MSLHTRINAALAAYRINAALAAYVSVINALAAIGIPIVMGLTTGSIAGNTALGTDQRREAAQER